MSSPNEQNADVTTRMALIEKEFGIVHNIFQKFENALEKMTDATASVQKLLAVHEQRINEREKAEQEIFEAIERRRDEYARHAERVSEKMDKMADELRKEIREQLTDLGNSVRTSLTEMKSSQQEIVKKIDEGAETTDDKFKEMETRIRILERWRWLMVGGGAVIGFVIAKWSIVSSLFGLGG